jgi:hypothetical protein
MLKKKMASERISSFGRGSREPKNEKKRIPESGARSAFLMTEDERQRTIKTAAWKLVFKTRTPVLDILQ